MTFIPSSSCHEGGEEEWGYVWVKLARQKSTAEQIQSLDCPSYPAEKYKPCVLYNKLFIQLLFFASAHSSAVLPCPFPEEVCERRWCNCWVRCRISEHSQQPTHPSIHAILNTRRWCQRMSVAPALIKSLICQQLRLAPLHWPRYEPIRQQEDSCQVHERSRVMQTDLSVSTKHWPIKRHNNSKHL